VLCAPVAHWVLLPLKHAAPAQALDAAGLGPGCGGVPPDEVRVPRVRPTGPPRVSRRTGFQPSVRMRRVVPEVELTALTIANRNAAESVERAEPVVARRGVTAVRRHAASIARAFDTWARHCGPTCHWLRLCSLRMNPIAPTVTSATVRGLRGDRAVEGRLVSGR
jgi:hypothetical protein